MFMGTDMTLCCLIPKSFYQPLLMKPSVGGIWVIQSLTDNHVNPHGHAITCFDLGSKVFLFPKSTASAYVILKPMVSKPLNKLTVCLRSYTELTREHSLFSLAMPGPGKDNTFLIFPRPPNFCSVYIGQEETRIKVDAEVLDWKHTCVSWDSYTGVIQLWVNGKLYPRRVSKKGFTIAPQTSIVLGQEQDSFGGGFDVNQSFMGEISDVHMWNYSLTPDDIQKVVFNNKALNGNVISWRSLQYEINGEALVQRKLQCKISEYTYSTYSKCYEEHLHDKVILPQTGENRGLRMGKFVLWFLFFSGTLAGPVLHNKVFLFPKETSTSYVKLTPLVRKPLEKITVCLRFYTDLSRSYSLFSLANPGMDNAFLIYISPPNSYYFSVGNLEILGMADSEGLDWKHICVSWDSDTGVLQFWVNGKAYPRKVLKKGFSIGVESSIILGQEQDSYGGGFDEKQSFVGEISDVHVWDYVLSFDKIQKVLLNDDGFSGNVINWRILQYELAGEILIQPKSHCTSWKNKYLHSQCYEDLSVSN
ncbi:uncharacterized protein WCC33_017486 [Rhinophrynus dorsalis]